MNNNQKSMQIKFDKIRPGTYYKEYSSNLSTYNREPMWMLSDGTVFANGDMNISDTKEFRDVGIKLAHHLHMHLPAVYDKSFRPKFNTVWCTLGYFNCNDFIVDRTFEETFMGEKFANFRESTTVQELWIVKHERRTLKNAKKIYQIKL